MRSSRFVFIGSVAVFGLTLLIGYLIRPTGMQLNGSLINPATAADDFQLTDQNGKAFQLSTQRGKIILLFFGYTHCPDVCPMTLAQFRDIKAALGSQAEQVEFVFVTVDPEQDSVIRMKEYVNAFDPQIIGLTGTQSELETVWMDYGVYQEKLSENDGSNNTVDHSTRTYLIDQQGKLLLTYPSGFETDKVIQDIQNLLRSYNG